MPLSKYETVGEEVTIKDVAQAAGVSIRTVSRVLNKSPKVGSGTREQIQAVIDRLGFSPNSRARGLNSGRSYLIGIVQSDQNAHTLGALQRGAAKVCAEDGFELVVHPSQYDDPDIAEQLTAFVRRSRVDGLLLLSPLGESESLAAALKRLSIPAVAMAAARTPHYGAMLVSDEWSASRSLGEHLLELGHRRIAAITGPLRFRSSNERLNGLTAALAAAGITLDPGYICEGDYGFDSGLAAARKLLALPERPTAIVAGNDIMAAGVLEAAAELGIDIPGGLSVAGFDDSDLASMVSPALTTVHRPLEEMARAATRTLLALIRDDPSPLAGDIRIDLTLVVRESTAAIAS